MIPAPIRPRQPSLPFWAERKEAEHTYELAFAAPLGLPAGIPGNSSGAYTANRDDILSHYKKLTGKERPTTQTKRLPNGQWSLMPAEELSRMRETKLGKQPNLSGSAEFSIVFSPGKVESVRYVSGPESFKALTDMLASASYQVEFPAGSTARLVRRVVVSCFPASGCSAVLLPVSTTRIGQF